jgi:hypothetical protein
VGGVDLLVREETQGLRPARGGAGVVQRRPAPAGPGRVLGVAAQASLRPGHLPDQAAVGCGDAHRAGRRPAALQLPGGRHPHHTAGFITRLAGRLHITWVGTLHLRTTVVWHGRHQQVAALAGRLRLGWRRPRLGLRAAVVSVYAPSYGMLRLVVTRNRHGNHDDLVTGEPTADLTQVVARKQSSWQVATVFCDTKQYAGLGACQCWTDQATVRHVALVLLSFLVLQRLRLHPAEPIAAVKERWQLTVTRQGEHPPAPQNACPAQPRSTA